MRLRVQTVVSRALVLSLSKGEDGRVSTTSGIRAPLMTRFAPAQPD